VDITLKPAGESDRSTLDNLMQLYIHDFSEFTQEDIDDDGRYSYPYLSYYWQDPDRFPFLICANGKLAGFVLARRETDPETNLPNMDMSEFFVLRAFRRVGVGSEAAAKVWDQFPESWHLKVLKQNLPAVQFWKRLISDYTCNNFVEFSGANEILFTFDSQ